MKYIGMLALIIPSCFAQPPTKEPMPPQQFFTAIYHQNSWVNPNTRSGCGSDLPETPIIRRQIPELLKKLDAKSVLDAGCGEFYWLKEVNLDFLDFYMGVDIVKEIIDNNTKKYGNEQRSFSVMNIVEEDLPTVDVVLCRDVFQHYGDMDIKRIVANIKLSNSKYLLTSTFRGKKQNNDPLNHANQILALVTGIGRNLEIEPFNFPKPLYTINEGFQGKTLGLWNVADLPDYTQEIASIDIVKKNIDRSARINLIDED